MPALTEWVNDRDHPAKRREIDLIEVRARVESPANLLIHGIVLPRGKR
jgi:hypothetical protein